MTMIGNEIRQPDQPYPPAPTPSSYRIATEKATRIDWITEFLSDRLSPILVKETRQALKSKQFFWTFFVLLGAVIIWTMIGLTFNDATVEFGNAGPALLVGYWVILGFPLAVVIPYGAYRSLAREFEDGTIQLVSVTTMKAWQIIAGKLGSAMLQMLVFVSVLAPCIAFTYLLRGLSIPQIVLGMVICIVGSFTLTCISLFFAGSNRSRIFTVGISIILILILFFVWGLWIAAAGGIAFGELVFLTRVEGAFVSFGLVALMVSTALLMFASATSLISFESDNRSSLVRITMLIQQFLFVAWCVSLMCNYADPYQIVGFVMALSHYWLVMGLILIGEKTELSNRVRRSIPKSQLGRAFTSLLFPGSGRGFLFAVVNIWLGVAIFTALHFASTWFPPAKSTQMSWTGMREIANFLDWHQYVGAGCLAALYPSFFLSLVYLFFCWLRKYSPNVTGVVTFSLGLVMIATLSGFVLLFHYNVLSDYYWRDYTPEQVLNWHWTATEFSQNGFNMPYISSVLFMAGVMLAVFIVAIWRASGELLQSQLVTPERVQQEILEMKETNRPEPGESIDEIFAADD